MQKILTKRTDVNRQQLWQISFNMKGIEDGRKDHPMKWEFVCKA